MRWVFIVAFALILGYGFVQFVNIYPDNYVKIYVDTYLVEMSFTAFLLLLILSSGAIYVVFWLLGSTFRASNVFSRWRKKRSHLKANQSLGTGYLALIKGDWKKAEKSLIAKTDNSAVPYINYLAAAQAAQEQSQIERRDEYLALAYKVAPNERFAIGLAKARLHHLAGQHEQAEATLNDIEGEGRKNSQFIAMLLQTYQATENWDGVHDLLPAARKYDVLPAELLEKMDVEAHQALLLRSSDRQATWRQLPKVQQQKPENIALYAKDLMHNGDNGAAEKLLRVALKNQYDESLISLYGKLSTEKPAKLRRVIEGWLMARPESAELNLAAGRMALQEKNSEQAIEFLEKAISLGQLPGAFALLGEVLESNNESGRALQLYRAGLAKLATVSEPSLGLAVPADEVASTSEQEPSQGELITRD